MNERELSTWLDKLAVEVCKSIEIEIAQKIQKRKESQRRYYLKNKGKPKPTKQVSSHEDFEHEQCYCNACSMPPCSWCTREF